MSRRLRLVIIATTVGATIATGLAWWALVVTFGDALVDDPYSPYPPTPRP